MADEDVLARLRQVVSDYLFDDFLMRRMEADTTAAMLVGKVEESGLLTARAPFQFGDGETTEGPDGERWVQAKYARRWIELAQDGEAKFREARERALLHCNEAIRQYGQRAAVYADTVYGLLQLDYAGAPVAPANLQPEAAGDRDIPTLKQQHAETYGVPVETVKVRRPGDVDVLQFGDKRFYSAEAYPLAATMQQRRNVRIDEQALRAVLGLDEAEHIRSVTAYQEPLTVCVQVISPEWEPIPYDSEAPILTFIPNTPAFVPCVAGNQHGECVLVDGHGQDDDMDSEKRLHVTRNGARYL